MWLLLTLFYTIFASFQRTGLIKSRPLIGVDDLEPRINEEVVGGQGLRGKHVAIVEVSKRIGIGREEVIKIVEEDYDEVAKVFLIKEIKKDFILLQKATLHNKGTLELSYARRCYNFCIMIQIVNLL